MKTSILLIAFFAFMLNASSQIKINADRQLCTTDGYPFAFKAGYTLAGFTGNADKSNVSFGYGALSNALITGTFNTAVGYQALLFNTTGNGNTANGSYALFNNTTGHYNTANGQNALVSNISGNGNTANGYNALYKNTGEYNTATGAEALFSNTTGQYNTATGSQALRYNTTGYNNVASGYSTLYNNTTGYNNIAVGYEVLYDNTEGYNNIAVGFQTLYDNTTGYNNIAIGNQALGYNITGSYNTAIGTDVLLNNASGNHNTANGSGALIDNVNGSNNTAIGDYALRANLSGSGNTAVGNHALYYNEIGSYNIAIGNSAGVNDYMLNNTIVIGCSVAADASNQVRLGNYMVTSTGGAVSWSTVSDGRAKTNIRTEVPGLNFINRLQPVTYNLDLKAIDELTKSDDPEINAHRDSLQAAMSPEERKIMEEARANKEKQVYSGFIAQDVEKAAKETGYNFSGVDTPENEKGIYGLRYAEFVVPLVKAVQELSEQNSRLQEQINELTGKKPVPERVIASAEVSTATGSGASLEQNIPNPFNQNTEIRFYLPASVTNAALCIYDLQGKQLKQITLAGRGEGSQIISGSEFSAGIYLYALIADGQEVDVKRMILTE